MSAWGEPICVAVVALAAVLGVGAGLAGGQGPAETSGAGDPARSPGAPPHRHPPGTPPHEHPPAPVRVTMEELHRHGGVPPGWRFRLPPGDPKAGREVFVKLECFKCHAVRGEQFPGAPGEARDTGPELTGMGAHHPAEYLAESILNPNAVIVTGPGHTGPDGLSTMPDYRDSLTVGELIDLVAYLKSLGEPDPCSPAPPATSGPDGGGRGHGAGPHGGEKGH